MLDTFILVLYAETDAEVRPSMTSLCLRWKHDIQISRYFESGIAKSKMFWVIYDNAEIKIDIQMVSHALDVFAPVAL